MKRKLWMYCAALLVCQSVSAQDSIKQWTLQECLDYALENNIQLQKSRNDYLSGVEDTKMAKAARLPSLSVTSSQGFTNYPSASASFSDSHSGSYGFSSRNSYTGTYGINAGLTLYNGGKLRRRLNVRIYKTRSMHYRWRSRLMISVWRLFRPTCRLFMHARR